MQCKYAATNNLTATDLVCYQEIETNFSGYCHSWLKLELSGVLHLFLQTAFNKINNGFSHLWTLLASNALSSVSMANKQGATSNRIKQLFIIPQL